MPFTDADEPLTFVAHGDDEVLRVSRTAIKEPTWLLELFTPMGRSTILVKQEDADDLAAMLSVSKRTGEFGR